MRFWTGVSAAFGAGTLIGTVIGTLLVEKKLKAEYEAASASMRRAYEAASIDRMVSEMPALTEEDLIITHPTPEGTALEGGEVKGFDFAENVEVQVPEVVVKPTQTNNPYHTAVRETASQGVYASYVELSEEDYYDEDGRAKEQITMLFSDGEPLFFKDGAEQETSDVMDWVGSTIVDDMRKAVREGNPTIYMRNAQTDIDYEVIFEQP